MAGVSVLAGDVSRTWMIESDGKEHEVQLFHNTVSGTRSVMVDGEEEAGTAGKTSMFTALETVPFTIGDRSGLIRISCNKKAFVYQCEYHGITQTEENDKLVNVPSSPPISVTLVNTCVSAPSTGEVRRVRHP